MLTGGSSLLDIVGTLIGFFSIILLLSLVVMALVQLVHTYRALGYVEDAEEMCGALRQYHPDTKDLNELCPVAGG